MYVPRIPTLTPCLDDLVRCAHAHVYTRMHVACTSVCRLKCDYLITAFGAHADGAMLAQALAPLQLNKKNGPYSSILVIILCECASMSICVRARSSLPYIFTCFLSDCAVAGQIDVTGFGQSSIPGLFAGGDIIGATTTVQAVNDGKTAAWGIHAFLQVRIPHACATKSPFF